MSTAPLPPGPSEPMLVQALRWIARPIPFLEDCQRRYGDCFTIRITGSYPLVLFSSRDAIKDIFTAEPDTLHAGEARAVVLEGLLGPNSLLVLDGARHQRQRRLMMPAFHGERMRTYSRLIAEATLKSLRDWPQGVPFALNPRMQAITLEVIVRAVFGVEDGARFSRLFKLLGQVLDEGAAPGFLLLNLLLSSQRVMSFVDRGLEPVKVAGVSLNLGRLMPWNGLARAIVEVDEILYAEIARRRQQKIVGEDILSLLISATNDDGEVMSDEELRDEMLTLLVAARDTTATTLSWVVARLIERPDLVARIRAELATAPGPVTDEAATDRCRILDATTKETLRLQPLFPLLARMLKRPTRIGGHLLPAGCGVAVSTYLTHRNPAMWESPLEFMPERFIGRHPDPYEYLPFGGGVRRCLGMAFANYEMQCVLAEVLARVDSDFAPGYLPRLVRRGITFAPSDGLRVVARLREPSA